MKNFNDVPWRGKLSFLDYPHVYVHYNQKGNSLVRVIDETPVFEEKEMAPMDWKKWVLYFLFLYTPGKEDSWKPEPILRRETLVENVNGFEIVEEENGYGVLYR